MTHQADAPRKLGKNAFLFVVVAVILNMLSFGIIMPVMPALLEDITGLTAKDSVSYAGWMSMTFAIANFFATPVLGGLSDRYGRRPVLLVSIAFLGVDLLIMGFAPTLSALFVGRFLGGLFSATLSVSNAYIADVTEPEDRGRAFGILGAAFGIGFVLGPVFGGMLGEINARLPFFVAAGICGLNFLYGLFVLPESLPQEDRRPFQITRANPFGALAHFAKIPRVAWFIVTIGLYQIAHAVYPSTWNFYTKIRYEWSELEIGISLAVVGLISAVCQGLLTGYLIKWFGAMRTATIGIAVNMMAMFSFSLAGAPWMAYAIILVSGVGGVVMPAINTITSTLTPRNAQGELQGAQSSIMALTLVFSPVLMTQTLQYFATLPDGHPLQTAGAAFALASVITALSLIPFMIGAGINRRAIADADSKIASVAK
ncbi:MAG: TCR/Tet family MFS transporter [Pseudomonadota bacterium]